MTDRDAFLATVRERLAGGLPANLLRPMTAPGDTTADIDYAVDLSDAIGAFTAAATSVGAEVVAMAPGSGLREVVDGLYDDGVRSAVVSRDPEVADAAALLADAGIEVLPAGDVSAAARADLGVTGARFGIALTGSVVVDSRRAGTRLASLLPPAHLVVLARTTILPTPGALLRHLVDHLPDGLPSNLVLISGHSRSADIELQLTPGVHGPRRVIVALS